MEYNNYNLNGKKILITGASSGIGKQIAIQAACYGANLILTGRNPERLNATLSAISQEKHQAIPADLTKKEDVDLIIQSADTLDGLVHAAGITRYMPAHLMTGKAIKEIMEINYNAPVLLTSGLLRKKKIQPSASVVFISTIATQYPYFGGSLYVSSKAALEGYAKVLALEVASKKIRVNSVLPAFVNTPLLTGAAETIGDEGIKRYEHMLPLGFGKVQDVANTVIYLLSEHASWITGQQIKMGAL